MTAKTRVHERCAALEERVKQLEAGLAAAVGRVAALEGRPATPVRGI